jgi:hypothetical protein
VWPVLIQLCEGHGFHSTLVDALHFVESKVWPAATLSRNPWRARLFKVGFGDLLKAAGASAAYHKKGGSKIWGEGIVKSLNHGVRTFRLPETL